MLTTGVLVSLRAERVTYTVRNPHCSAASEFPCSSALTHDETSVVVSFPKLELPKGNDALGACSCDLCLSYPFLRWAMIILTASANRPRQSNPVLALTLSRSYQNVPEVRELAF
jgi:hypothetical protein